VYGTTRADTLTCIISSGIGKGVIGTFFCLTNDIHTRVAEPPQPVPYRIASSTGLLLKTAGLKVTAIKIDPYMNIDAGTMAPTEHGEWWASERASGARICLSSEASALRRRLRVRRTSSRGRRMTAESLSFGFVRGRRRAAENQYKNLFRAVARITVLRRRLRSEGPLPECGVGRTSVFSFWLPPRPP
jgi:hypothetical protein